MMPSLDLRPREQDIFDAMPLPVMVIDLATTRLLAVNDAAVLQYGYGREELVTMTLADLKFPEDLPRLEEDLAKRATNTGLLGVRRHRTKDGASLQMEVVSRPITVGGRAARLAIFTDVTERLKAEAHMRHAQKMEAVGRLAGGVAHDFNNMLAVICADAEFALGSLEPDHPAAQDVQEIASVAKRAEKLVRQLLTFGRRTPRKPTRLELNDVVAEAHKMLERTVGDEIEMSVVLASRLGTIEADASQIEQAIVNLVLNARDAIAGSGQIVVATKNVDLDARGALEAGLRPGRYVCLSVTDTGSGMDEATRQRIFEPFFTTKPHGQGSGLGLPTVFAIVEESGGAISVASELGAGSVLRLYFPRTDGARSRPAMSAVRPSSTRIAAVRG
jgi:PAS domain S-box-containing protein